MTDRLIALADGTRIRSLAPPEIVHAPGSAVDVFLPVGECRVVAQ